MCEHLSDKFLEMEWLGRKTFMFIILDDSNKQSFIEHNKIHNYVPLICIKEGGY